MKINTILFLFFFGVLVYAGIEYSTGITGVTEKNGDGCTCHNLTPEPTVWVRIEGPDTLLQGQTAQYTLKLSGGPAISGGFNVAAYSGVLNLDGNGVQKIGDELTQTSPRMFVDSVVSWTFSFTAGNTNYIDTLYSVANSVNGNGDPTGDQWNFGAKFPIVVLDVIPVELTSFTASIINGSVNLNWQTATEVNNSGFVIERSVISNPSGMRNLNWEDIGFVNGFGTTTSSKQYSFTDNSPLAGNLYYRLKQMDFDGSFTYSNVIEIDIKTPAKYSLEQNYPNPFNPSTVIRYQLSVNSYVTLKVYDVLGNEVAVLVDEFREAGRFEITFDASNLASGMYLYRLQSGNYIETKKMVIIK
ncbi:MAG TPA: T9SS type A sorting domain-containing protein [Ignavibacteriaceae bacterium]|nr:T9SS type A sorting domain-containing protein [Ignavibacteriaceae bacterium]